MGFFVQVGRLELPSLAALIPETSVSTNSTTPAQGVQKYKTGVKFSEIFHTVNENIVEVAGVVLAAQSPVMYFLKIENCEDEGQFRKPCLVTFRLKNLKGSANAFFRRIPFGFYPQNVITSHLTKKLHNVL